MKIGRRCNTLKQRPRGQEVTGTRSPQALVGDTLCVMRSLLNTKTSTVLYAYVRGGVLLRELRNARTVDG
jgi:hypothetical protein